MGKMIYLMGKSSTGKDTIYKHLLQWKEIPFEKVVLYTTRPIRAHEKNGREYHFTDEVHYQELQERLLRIVFIRPFMAHGVILR